jgi:uncharacterized protein
MSKVWMLVRFWYDSFRRRNAQKGTGVERSGRLPLERDQIALVILALADGGSFTPVQVQKALFLASDKVSEAFADESHYDFQPYDYGPFDRQVYLDIQDLERRGLAQIDQAPESRWRTYAATEAGIAEGGRLTRALKRGEVEILERIAKLVRSLSFNDLVSAIYRAYPHMRERSVFRD